MASVLNEGSSTRIPSKWTCTTGPPLPICSLSPEERRCLTIRRPLMSVPLVEAVSTTNQLPSSSNSSAWWFETLGSFTWSKRTSQSGARPMRSTGFSSSVVRPCRLPDRCFNRIIPDSPSDSLPRLRLPCRAPPAIRSGANSKCAGKSAGGEKAKDLVAIGRALAAAVAVGRGDIDRAVGTHHHVAQPACLVPKIHLVQLDDGGVRGAELHAVQVLGAERPDEQAAPPAGNGGPGVERSAARRDGGLPAQRWRDHPRPRLAAVDRRPAQVRSR